MKKKTLKVLQKYWQTIGLNGLWFTVIIGIYLFHINRPHSQGPLERATYHATHSLQAIFRNPLNAPYKIYTYMWLHLPFSNMVTARLASVSLALASVIVFYFLAKRWHGNRSAIYGTILFAASGWLLHVGRLGTDQIMLILIPLTLLLLASWLNTTKWHSPTVIILATICGLALFTPGAIWFVIAFLVICQNMLREHLKGTKIIILVSSLAILLVCLGILGYGVIQNMSLLREWLGAPTQLPTPIHAVKQWVDTLSFTFLRGPLLPELWLAHTPILDIASSILVIFGSALYIRHIRNSRTILLIAFATISSLLIAANGTLAYGFIVPITYLLVVMGLAYFAHQWIIVFPRNPVARGIAFSLLSLVVLFAVIYHLESYFYAWQNSPATLSTFRES